MSDNFGYFAAGVFVGVMLIALTFGIHPTTTYRQKIVCESAIGGNWNDAGCVVGDRVVKVNLK